MVLDDQFTILLQLYPEPAQMITSGWSEDLAAMRVEWRSVSMETGAQYVMMPGIQTMPLWCADNWASVQPVLLHAVMPSLARELVTSSLTMWRVLGLSHCSLPVQIMELVSTTVFTVKMPE